MTKEGRGVITLFEKYELVDALFDTNGQLWLTTSNQGLRIDLESLKVEDLYWNRAILGLRNKLLCSLQV